MESWPTSVPETLWGYVYLQRAAVGALPMMGVRFDPIFLLTFVIGALFLGLFAARRFDDRTAPAGEGRFRVLSNLEPGDMGGTGALQRAFLLYLGALLAIYAAFTFFGRVAFQLIGRLPIAGVQVDTARIDFNAPQWPLLLAFGFAGLAPLLPPLTAAEVWLRERAQRAVGIPVRVRQTTRRLLAELNREGEAAILTALGGKSTWLPAEEFKLWIRDRIGSVEDLRLLILRVELLCFWVRHRTSWPDAAMSEKLRELEAGAIRTAQLARIELRNLNREEFLTQPGTPTAASGTRTDPAAPEDTSAARARQSALHKRLTAMIEALETSLEDLATLQVIAVERDPDFHDNDEMAPLQFAVLDRIRRQDLGGVGPELGLLIGAPVVLLVYWLAISFGLHDTVNATPRPDALNVLISAGFEMLRYLALVFLPLLTAFTLRQELVERGTWPGSAPASHQGDQSALRLQAWVIVGAAVLVVATLAMALIAMLAAFLISESSAKLREMLTEAQAPVLSYYLKQAPVALVLAWAALRGTERRITGRRPGGLAMAGLVVVAYWAANRVPNYWSISAERLAEIPEGRQFPNYWSYHEVTTLAILGGATWLAVSVLGHWRRGPRTDARASVATPAGAAATITILLLSTLCWASSAGPARSQATGPATSARPDAGVQARPRAWQGNLCRRDGTLHVGFRKDAEPFSYLPRNVAPESRAGHRYQGFLADLCYWILDPSGCTVIPVPVTGRNRFTALAQAKIDLLCDPVTLRYEERESSAGETPREAAGVFSPIVFLSGASYLSNGSTGPGVRTFIGYLQGTTASPQVTPQLYEKLCHSNLLRDTGCAPNFTMTKAEYDAGPGDEASGRTGARLIAFPSHDALVAWVCRQGIPKDTRGDTRIYLGDRELIRAKLETWTKAGNPCPGVDPEPVQNVLTYEPYVLMTRNGAPDLAKFVQRQVYRFFSHRALATGLFAAHFPEQRMSDPLAYLFLLNAVEPESGLMTAADHWRKPAGIATAEIPRAARSGR